MSDTVKVYYTPNGPGIKQEKEVTIEELTSLDSKWNVAEESKEKVEELGQSGGSNRSGFKSGSHGLAVSDRRMEKYGLTEEELGQSTSEESEEDSVVEEALQNDEEPDTIEELWKISFENEREEKGYSNTHDSKEEKVKEITDQMGRAWSDPEEEGIDTDELAEKVAEKIDGERVEELDSPFESATETTEELEETPPEVKQEAISSFRDRGGAWSDIADELENELAESNPVPNTSVEELENGRTRLTTKHKETREECQALLNREESMHLISDRNGVMTVEFEDTSIVEKYI